SRGGADEPLAVLRERHNGRRGAAALGVRNDGGLAALEHGHARVRRAQVDADCLSHCGGVSPFLLRKSKRFYSRSWPPPGSTLGRMNDPVVRREEVESALAARHELGR